MRNAVVTALLCLGTAAGQTAQGTGSLEAIVLDSTTQSGIRKAQIMLMPRQVPKPPSTPGGTFAPVQPHHAMADANGSFRFADLAPGQYGLMPHHPRYPQQPMQMTEIEVKAGETTRVRLALRPGASISGRVLDAEGDPIAGCVAQLQHPAGEMLGIPGHLMGHSNESGEYRVWGVPAGKYVLVARCGRLPFQPRPLSSGPPAPPTLAYVPSYYPDVPERSAAQVVELHAGDERTGLDFRLTTARVYTVSGVLTAPAGQSLQHMMVEMVKRSDVNPFDRRGGRRVNPATGEFSIDGVFPGSYELVAASHNPNLLEPPLGARQGAEVTDRPLKVNLTLVTGKDITGTLSVDTDRPYDHKQLTLHLMPVDPGRMAGGPAPVQPDAAGNFVLKGVLPGRWRLAVHGGPEVFVRSIDFAGRTVDGEIEIASGSAGPLRLVLSTRGATLEGTGTPGRQYLVMEADLDRRFNIPRTVLADAQGRIFIPSLPPGKYRIYEGRVPLPDTPYREITATEGGKVTVELKAAN